MHHPLLLHLLPSSSAGILSCDGKRSPSSDLDQREGWIDSLDLVASQNTWGLFFPWQLKSNSVVSRWTGVGQIFFPTATRGLAHSLLADEKLAVKDLSGRHVL